MATPSRRARAALAPAQPGLGPRRADLGRDPGDRVRDLHRRRRRPGLRRRRRAARPDLPARAVPHVRGAAACPARRLPRADRAGRGGALRRRAPGAAGDGRLLPAAVPPRARDARAQRRAADATRWRSRCSARSGSGSRSRTRSCCASCRTARRSSSTSSSARSSATPAPTSAGGVRHPAAGAPDLAQQDASRGSCSASSSPPSPSGAPGLTRTGWAAGRRLLGVVVGLARAAGRPVRVQGQARRGHQGRRHAVRAHGGALDRLDAAFFTLSPGTTCGWCCCEPPTRRDTWSRARRPRTGGAQARSPDDRAAQRAARRAAGRQILFAFLLTVRSRSASTLSVPARRLLRHADRDRALDRLPDRAVGRAPAALPPARARLDRRVRQPLTIAGLASWRSR